MDTTARVAPNCFVPDSTKIQAGSEIADRVVLAGDNIVIGSGATLETACIIASNVEIGRGALVRTGAVVLSSVPPHAIVEGNPAQVVGYRENTNPEKASLAAPRRLSSEDFDKAPRPSNVALGIGKSALYFMRKITDARGSLTVGEMPSEVPFEPVRYFVAFDVPSVKLRGEHAHKRCQQFLICLHGSCQILLDDGVNRCELTLDRPDVGVFMPEMIWGTQYKYSSDAVLLVFASRPYEADDYLRTYDEFLTECEKQAK